MAENKYVNSFKDKTSSIRLRTWTLTLAIVVTLIFYFVVQVSTKQTINPIDFIFICIMQIMAHCLYFPDGEIFGQKSTSFVSNKEAYNTKASGINQERKIGRLREYCKIEYEERKQRYILNECGTLDITLDELSVLKKLSEKEIKKLKQYEFEYEVKKTDGTAEKMSKLIFFSRPKRKKLHKLLFKELPIEQNHPETIMSAVENNGIKSIRDGSIAYKTRAYIKKFLTAIVFGGIFAYIGYTVRDGIGITEIVQILMYLTSLFSTAVMSFSSGETCSKVYKSRFYIELVNFIDGFIEWDSKIYPQETIIVKESE